MRSLLAVLICAICSLPVYAGDSSQTFWLLEKGDWHTWCGYASLDDFKTQAERLRPTDTIRITYSSNRLSELTYQVNSESGDWIVIDRYTPLDDQLRLKRANLLVQPKLEVIQETTITSGKAQPFRVVRVKSLGQKGPGAKVDISKLDYPSVKFISNISAAPFMKIVAEMRKQKISTLCEKVE